MRYIEGFGNVPLLGEKPIVPRWTPANCKYGHLYVIKETRAILREVPGTDVLLSDQDVLNVFAYCMEYYSERGADVPCAKRKMVATARQMLQIEEEVNEFG